MSSSYYITFGTDRVTYPGVSGSIAWEAPSAVPLFNIEFGEDNVYSAGLTAEYNGNVVYSSPLDSAKRTASNIPSGSKITFDSRAPDYRTFDINTSVSGLSDATVGTTNWDIDGASASASGYLTADGSIRLANGAYKYFQVTGNFNMPNSNGATACYYARPTATATGAYRYMRSIMSGTVNSYCSGGNGNASSNAAGFRGISASGFYFSGTCTTKGEHLGRYDTYIATVGVNSLQVNGENFGSRSVSNSVGSLYNNNTWSNKNKPTLNSWGSTTSTAGWFRSLHRSNVNYSNGYVRVANLGRNGSWSASGISI